VAEVEGSRLDPGDFAREEAEYRGDDPSLPAPLRRAAARAGAAAVRVFPAGAPGSPVAILELYRVPGAFPARVLTFARLAAAQVAAIAQLERLAGGSGADGTRARLPLEPAGDALAAGTDEAEAAAQIARLAAEAAGAVAAVTWRVEPDAAPGMLAVHGFDGEVPDRAAAAEAVQRAVDERRRDAMGRGPDMTVTIPLGEPPVGALQLYFDEQPAPEILDGLSTFAGRAAVALRQSRRAELTALALTRSQTVIAVVSQAIARLSLAHTLETAVERISELTGGRVAVYLREQGGLSAAAARGLSGPHEEVAERLLELALGPSRSRGFLVVPDARADPRLVDMRSVVAASDIRRALLVPLAVRDEVIGALGVFEPRARPYREGEEALLIALSTQLAVAVENARLHERAKELGDVLERTLESERQAAHQLRALYDISRSFTESLSLEATLEAIARTMVEVFHLDAAAIRMPDERGQQLEARAVHVADPNLAEAARLVLGRPQPITAPLARRMLRFGEPVILTREAAHESDAHRPLEPFLLKGATAAVLPMTATGEVLGTITLLSLDPARPLERETVAAAMNLTPQAALAIDNARLYQQQKDFSDEMQRSLLPRELPPVPGIDVGHVYQSSARLDVGGDVYDFLALGSGKLAVVLGDVTGKGIQAAADMALAKFAFRALARSHPEPSAFLAQANEVVFEEIAVGKFITMLYLLVDGKTKVVRCASAGHPPVRVVSAEGAVSALGPGGLALGIEGDQEYPEDRVELGPGDAVVLYTDGVVEARRGTELYGEERLDAFLRARHGLGAQELADAILAECRAFSGGDLADDCAVVVIRLAQ
jgi:serine phosphatase RsbU (regulator of sigma subunit)